MKVWIAKMAGLLSLSLLAVLGTTASAQTFEDLGNNNWNVRAGVFLPTDSNARDAEGDIWLTFGAEARFFNLPPPTGGVVGSQAFTLSADFYGSGDLYAVPVLVNYRGQTDQFFYSAGIGIAFNRGRDNETGTDFAWQLMAGYDFAPGPTPVFGAVKYTDVASNGLDGFSFVIGVRF